MSRRLFVTSFGNERDIVDATRAVRAMGHEIKDVYTPYAVHGLDKAMGLRPSRLPWVCLLFGVLGATAKLWFQIWTSAFNWPVNIGGKPLASIPAFVPVTFEITVLFAGLGTVAAFFLVSRLRPGKKPGVTYHGVTNDRFVLVLVEKDASFDVDRMKEFCQLHHCLEVYERLEEETE